MSDSIVSERQKFKRTPAGSIPVDWDCRPLGEIAEIVGGGTPDRKAKEYWGGSIPWATPTDATATSGTEISLTAEKITDSGLKNSAARLMPVGSVLMSSRATIGYALINTVPMATNQGFANFICSPELDNYFLLYLLRSKAGELARISVGSTFLEIPKTALSKMLVQVPPLAEQRRIAAILSELDRNIEITKKCADGYRNLQAGCAWESFSADSKNKCTSAPIGRCAAINWETLGSRTDPQKNISYIDIASITSPGVMRPPNPMTFKDAPSRARRLVKRDDVLVSTVRPYLRAFVRIKSDEPNLVASTGFAVLTPGPQLRSDYLYHYVMSERFVHFLQERMTGSNYPAVAPRDVADCPIPLPSMAEQEIIACRLEALDAYARLLEAEADKQEQLKQSLANELLAGRIRPTHI